MRNVFSAGLSTAVLAASVVAVPVALASSADAATYPCWGSKITRTENLQGNYSVFSGSYRNCGTTEKRVKINVGRGADSICYAVPAGQVRLPRVTSSPFATGASWVTC